MGVTRFAQQDLARLSYEVVAHDAPSARTAVLLHGTLGDRRSMGPLRDTLSAHMQLVLPDARGHGASSALSNRTFSITDMANDLYAVLEAESLVDDDAAPLHLLGVGQGAMTALELARQRPDRVASLVLIEPDAPALLDGIIEPYTVMMREEARATNKEAADLAYKELSDQALSRYLDRRWGPGWQQLLTPPQRAATRRHLPALYSVLHALDSYRVMQEEVTAITQPVLLVKARTTPQAEQAIVTRLSQWFRNAREIEVMSLAGAAPFAGDGSQAVEIITRWVEQRLQQEVL